MSASHCLFLAVVVSDILDSHASLLHLILCAQVCMSNVEAANTEYLKCVDTYCRCCDTKSKGSDADKLAWAKESACPDSKAEVLANDGNVYSCPLSEYEECTTQEEAPRGQNRAARIADRDRKSCGKVNTTFVLQKPSHCAYTGAEGTR